MKIFAKTGFAVVLTLSLIIVGQARKYKFVDGKIEGISTIQELDEAAVFSFAIMSDNKGDSPSSKDEFARMVEWIDEAGDAFVIGLGDHVKKGWDNDFLSFLEENQWWQLNFYPNVADGENEFYGESQADWGAGAPVLDEVNLSYRPNVDIRENDCEYYAQIEVGKYTVHLIQLHYSDNPADDTIAFREDSREYLIRTLEGIPKGKRDIVIVGAHSFDGFWLDELSPERQKMVVEKADLVLSATTHFFTRDYLPHYVTSGALCINTGSITYPASYCPYGYVQVHILKKPFSMVVQYVNAARSKREMQHHEYSYVKVIDGPIVETEFRDVRPEEDMDVVVGVLAEAYPDDAMHGLVRDLYLEVTGAENAYINAGAGLPKGEVTLRDLWGVFPYNNEIYVLTLTAEEAEQTFGERLPLKGRSKVKLAINNYNGSYLIRKLNLPEERVNKTGIHEVYMLAGWVSKQE